MASPISPMEAIEILQKTVALYKKIRDAPAHFEQTARNMESLEFYLQELRALLNDRTRNSLASARPAQTARLQAIIGEIQVDAEKIYDILDKWEQKVGPFGLQIRFQSVAQAWFAINSSPEKLQTLSDSIEKHELDLGKLLQLMGLFGIRSINSASLQTAPVASSTNVSRGIVFIDPSNLGRSKVAEGYSKLLREWTVRTSGMWPIKFVHSAGINVRHRSDCVDILQQTLGPRNENVAGNKPPNETALASLFDNHLFNYPYKTQVKDTITKSRFRGINTTLFQTYDYIIVFVGREYSNLLKFKKALISSHGPQIAPRGKGRVVHLGAYLNSREGGTVEIIDASKSNDRQPNRANWNAKTGQIKASIQMLIDVLLIMLANLGVQIAIKGFLKTELAWTQPAPKSAQLY